MGIARAGFTVLELVVVLAILAVLSAVIAPQVISRLSQGEAAAISSSIVTVRDAILTFRGEVGRYPSTLVDLASEPASANDSCGNSIPSTRLSYWAGPYLGQNVTSAGIPVATGRVQAALQRSPAGYSAIGELLIQVTDVDRAAADEIEAAYDGDANFSAGNVRWTASSSDRGSLFYAIPIEGC